jgi:hypothetical protein
MQDKRGHGGTYVIRLLLGVALTIIIGTMTNGCTTVSSSVQKSTIDVPRSRDTAFYVLPFEPPEKQLVAKDRRVAGGVPLGILDIMIIKAIKESNPIFNYTLDEQDLANLRQSLVQSIEASKAFDTVEVFSSVHDERPSKGLFLIVRLEEAGVVGKFNYAAVIKGSARIEDNSSVILGETQLEAKETGTFTLSQSKNQAIRKVVEQVADLLKQVVIERNAGG